MKNCLVTKYKGVVDNDSLSKFGEVSFVRAADGGNVDDQWLVVKAINEAVSLETDGTITEGTSLVPAGDTYGFHIVSDSDVNISLSSVYNIEKLLISNIKSAKGISSLCKFIKYLSMRGSVAENIDFSNLNSNKNLVYVRFNEHVENVSMSAIAENNKNTIKMLFNGVETMPSSDCSELSALQAAYISGNIALLPTSMRDIYGNGEFQIIGNIEDYITKLRAAGRTSGAIKFVFWPSVFPSLYYNGTILKDYLTAQGISPNANVYVAWDASTITFSSTAPQSYVAPDSFI